MRTALVSLALTTLLAGVPLADAVAWTRHGSSTPAAAAASMPPAAARDRSLLAQHAHRPGRADVHASGRGGLRRWQLQR